MILAPEFLLSRRDGSICIQMFRRSVRPLFEACKELDLSQDPFALGVTDLLRACFRYAQLVYQSATTHIHEMRTRLPQQGQTYPAGCIHKGSYNIFKVPEIDPLIQASAPLISHAMHTS